MAQENLLEEEPFPWHLGVYDAHCHPTDTPASINNIPGMKTKALTIMATRGQDQDLVAGFAAKLGVTKDSMEAVNEENQDHRRFLVPSFGWHPWFSHQVYDDLILGIPTKEEHYKRVISPQTNDDEFNESLPEPRPLSRLLHQIRGHLEQHPIALVGEIGLDRAFRIPGVKALENELEKDPSLTPGGREGRRLSHYRVDMGHQRRILRAQLHLAGEMQRAVSVHGVAAHGLVYDTLKEAWSGHENIVKSKRERKRRVSVEADHENNDASEPDMAKDLPSDHSPKPYPPRICLHSYSGPLDTLKLYLHPSVPVNMFFSFSSLVNLSHTSKKAFAVIMAVPEDKILAESDVHAAGGRMDDLMEEIVRTICQIKGWSLETGVKQLASNWKHFIFGADSER